MAILVRFYVEATLMGLLIGLTAMLLQSWFGDLVWPLRLGALLLVGGLLCLAQYGVARLRR